MITKNVESARLWFESGWNERNDQVITDLMTENCIAHLAIGTVRGPKQFLTMRGNFLKAFPDLHLFLQDIVGEGNNVVIRWRSEGTHTGEAFGLTPTNKHMSFVGLTWLRFHDGKIVEGWDGWNFTGVFKEMGAS